jgi:hypothetical protein
MAVSSTSGDMGFVRQVTVILKEGNITVGSGYSPFGKTTTFGFASEIAQGDPVALSTDTGNTYEATGGNFVVSPIANGVDLCIGRIIDQPKWVREPSTSQSTWTTMLSSGYYRIATVELYFPMAIFEATLVCNNASAITPGTPGNLDIVAAASKLAHGLSVVDVGSSGSNYIIPLTYAPQSSTATVSLLIGFIGGFGTVTT